MPLPPVMAASVDCEISGVTASPVPRRWVASASSSNRNTTRSVSERVASEAITDPAHRIVPASPSRARSFTCG